MTDYNEDLPIRRPFVFSAHFDGLFFSSNLFLPWKTPASQFLVRHFEKKMYRLKEWEGGQFQGCQNFLGTTYQKVGKYAKWPQNLPNGHKICDLAVCKMGQIAIKNIFHCKTFQNLPKLRFLVWNIPSGNTGQFWKKVKWAFNVFILHIVLEWLKKLIERRNNQKFT
jgi:hypothetical protein